MHRPADHYDDRFLQTFDSSFRTFDSLNYEVITTVDTKKPLLDFCIDHSDNYVAVAELHRGASDESGNIVKLYEIGRRRELDEEEQDDQVRFPNLVSARVSKCDSCLRLFLSILLIVCVPLVQSDFFNPVILSAACFSSDVAIRSDDSIRPRYSFRPMRLQYYLLTLRLASELFPI